MKLHRVRRLIICFFAGLTSLLFSTGLSAWTRDRGQIWADGVVEIHLQLGGSEVYADGLTPNQVGAAAIAAWNPQMQRVQLVGRTGSTAPRGFGNGVNNVTFDTTILGTAFGDGVLGVEITDYDSTRRLESDVIINSNLVWDRYDGSWREDLKDLRRVLIHEFGHSLGLGHPDEAGQYYDSIMRSSVSYLTQLQTDDLDGIGALYGYTSTNPGRPPILVHLPESQTVEEGRILRITAEAVGAQPMTIRWFKDGNLLPEFTERSIHLPAVTFADAGAYHAIVSNVAGEVTTAIAQITVVKPIAPVVAFPDRNFEREAIEGMGFGLSLRVLGSPPFTYQWYRNGVPLAGATRESYGVSSSTESDAGQYHAVVSNLSGSAVSGITTITVEPLPVPRVSLLGMNARRPLYLEPGKTTLLRTYGSGYQTERWYYEGQPLPLGFSNTMSYSSTPPGDYAVLFTNSKGSSTSQIFRVVRGPVDTERVTPVPAVDPTRGDLTFDDILIDRRGNLILHSRLARNVWIWSVEESRFIATIPLLGGVNTLTYSSSWDRILVAYSDGRVTQIPLDGQPMVETVLARLGQSSVALDSIGDLLIVRWNEDYGATVLILDANGVERSRMGGFTGSNLLSWNPLRRRVYLTNGSLRSYFLSSFQVSSDGLISDKRLLTYGVEEHFAADPLIVSPTGELIVSGTNQIYDGVTLEHAGSLVRDVDAGVWISGALITADTTTQGVKLTRWRDGSFDIEGEVRVSGHSPRIFQTADRRLVMTTVSAGRLLISTFDEYLRPLTRMTHRGQDLLATQSKLSNLSTRVSLSDDGDGLLVAGFVIRGTEPMDVLLRAIGPGLFSFGIKNHLEDPSLTVFGSNGVVLDHNDNWPTTNWENLSQLFSKLGAFGLNPGSRDAVLRMTLQPGAYTVHVARGNQPGGIALLEIYDASPPETAAQLVNLSTRMHTGSGDKTLITGFVLAGELDRTLLVRAAGPSLARFGVPGLLQNPLLRIQQGLDVQAQNDDWSGLSSVVASTSAVGAFEFESMTSQDSALLFTCIPDAYTTQVTGVEEGAAGTVLVEIYTTD